MPVRRNPNHIPADDPKQGIVTILGADCDAAAKTASIRRTLSADMSSKKWLQSNGFFSPVKKIVSSHHIADHSDSDDEEFKFNKSLNQDEVWKSIQAGKAKTNEETEEKKTAGVWGLILTQKSDTSLLQLPTPPPYIHPLVKSARSSLSEKSLEVCTESLGSETGSDCFSCHSSDEERDEENQGIEREEAATVQTGEDPFAYMQIPKYKKSPAKPFPPPLPSIGATASLQMHSRREDGRLVVEAVSVAPKKYFHAQRHDGRLLLTLNRSPPESESESESEPEPESESESLVEELGHQSSLPTGMHKTGLVVKKLMVVGNINPKWANEEAATQALPPRPPVARPPPAAAFNAYEYFWRSKPGFMMSNKNSKMNQDLVRYMRGCKEARRSLIWEPYCIATS